MFEIHLQKYQTALQTYKEKEQVWQRLQRQFCDAMEMLNPLPEQAQSAASELRGTASALLSSAEVLGRFLAVLEEVGEAARRAERREMLLTENGPAAGSIGMRCVSLEHLRQMMTDVRFRDGGNGNE